MKVTFPHLGSMHIFCKAVAETAGIPYVLPGPTSMRTRETGEYRTNESVCLPLKIILGNLADGLDRGADTVVMVGSGPPCRLGLYDRVIKILLREMGHTFRWLTIPGVFNRKAFVQNYFETRELKKELAPSSFARFPRALVMGWRKMICCERLEQAAAEMRAAAEDPDLVDRRLARALEGIDRARDPKGLAAALRDGLDGLRSCPRSGREPLRVVLVGEVYTVMEPAINMDVERRLGRQGVAVERTSWFSSHIRRASRLDRGIRKERQRLLARARPYLAFDVGAECNFSVAEAVEAKQHGRDGVVHVYPFSCMPETNAAAVLQAVCEDLDLPVMGLAVDRQDMELRIDSQIEAFVDILRWRREGRVTFS